MKPRPAMSACLCSAPAQQGSAQASQPLLDPKVAAQRALALQVCWANTALNAMTLCRVYSAPSSAANVLAGLSLHAWMLMESGSLQVLVGMKCPTMTAPLMLYAFR